MKGGNKVKMENKKDLKVKWGPESTSVCMKDHSTPKSAKGHRFIGLDSIS